jgi:flagellar protein FlaI
MNKKALRRLMKGTIKAGMKSRQPTAPIKAPAPSAKFKTHLKKHIDTHKAIKTKAQKEEEEKFISEIHEHLEEAGVPEHISKKAHKLVHKPKAEEGHKEEVGKEIKKAVEAQKKGKISEEGLTKVVEAAVVEGEKEGISKGDLRGLIKEVLQSEFEKSAYLARYRELEELPELAPAEKAIDYTMPLPSIEGAEEVRRRAMGKGMILTGEEISQVNITYPLLVRKGKVRVYANIRYDPSVEGLLYRVIEPKITPPEQQILQKIEKTLIEELEVDFAMLKEDKAERYLDKKVTEVMEYYEIKVSARTRELLDYYITRDFIGLGRVEPLFQDPNIEDISCDGVGVPIYIYHRDPRFGSIKTNILFRTPEELDSFVMKLAQRCGRSISVADPLLDGALPDGSRVQATFGTGISMKGSNFTIRKFTKDPLTFVDLLNYGTVNAEMLAYYWLAIEHGKSILIAGPTASGKTTLLGSLALFLRPELKVVSIEDTPELRLSHENWVSQVARIGFGPESAAGKKLGEVSLFDLLKASLRQRPDEIIVGEVRGKEAYVLFQQMATGHPGLSTIHAESMQGVINRLRTPPIELPPSLVQHLDILIVITRQRIRGKYLRRIKETVEIVGYNVDKDRPLLNTAYTWVPAKDAFHYSGKSAILKGVMELTGSAPESMFLEVERRVKIIEWMQDNGIRDFKNVGRIVKEYYQDPEALLSHIGG